MDKYAKLMISFSLLSFITYLANLVELQTLSSIDPNFVQPQNGKIGEMLASLLGSFWNLVTFRLVGLPDIWNFFLNILIVYPIMVFIVHVLFNWARGVD